MAEQLAFFRLLLTGPGRNYEVNFRTGVNLISGPIFTGKSSVLQLIDYACGAKKPPQYPEISKCSDLYVECLAGGEVLTIRRSLKATTAKATIYPCPLSEVLANSMAGSEVAVRHVAGTDSVSSEILRRLGLADIEVKTAPTQESSDSAAFSLRDLLLLVHVDQERMGSGKRGFFEDHPFKSIKWKAGVEVVHGLYDRLAATTSAALKRALEEQDAIRKFLRGAQKFLDDFHIPPAEELEQRAAELAAEQSRLLTRLRETRRATEEQIGDNLEVVRRRTKIETERASAKARGGELRRTLVQLGRLRVQYERERTQLEFLKESETLVGHLPIVRCPECLQPIDPKPDARACYVCHRTLPPRETAVSVDARLRATRRRILDLEAYIAETEVTVGDLDRRHTKLVSELVDTDAALDRVREATVLPDSTALLDVTQAIALVDKQLRQAQEHLELRRRARGEGSNLLALEERVGRLRQEVEKATGSKKSPEEVVAGLSDRFVETLRAIKFPEVRDSRIDKSTFLPFVRNQVYGQLSSPGAIALAIVAWHLAVLRYSLEKGSLFPKILMLDSPLSHVGRDAKDEAFKDQRIVDAFYEVLLNLNRTRGAEFQLFVVDNRPPAAAKDLVVVSFTRDPNVGRFGLIDDEHPAAEEDKEPS